MKTYLIAAALVALPGTAIAADNVVSTTSQTVTIGGVGFGSSPGGTENTGGGATAINANRAGTAGGAGDVGSLEVKGDRSRYIIGNLFGTTASPGFLLSDLRSMTWDWNVGVNGTGQRHAAPVGRVIVADAGGARAELIWEYVYNGGTDGVNAPTDQWLTVGSDARWYANLRAPANNVLGTFKANSQANTDGFNIINASGVGQGVLANNGNQINQTLESWLPYFSANARVVGISFGAGSGFGTFTGYVDNVAVATALGTDRINFEPDVEAAVPEPATWALMLGGFGLVGGALRRRAKTTVRFA